MAESKMAQMSRGAKKQGGAIGTSIAVIGTWLLAEYGGVTPPAEVTAALASLLGAVGTYVQTHVL